MALPAVVSPATSVAIGLGTNLGQRQAQLVAARTALSRSITITACSHIYETPPWGGVVQPAFLNAVCLGTTTYPPLALLHTLKQIEHDLGRTPAARWGPRLIDLDILFYGDLVLATPELTLPHLHLAERAFVLLPLAELLPTWVHPQSERTISDLLAHVDQHGINRANDQWPV